MSTISEDLTRIRKEKRLSRQDVFDKCRVPMHTIEGIEDGSIFSGTMRNKTYLRSYIRTYAKSIGIQDADMIEALDQLDSGTYDGFLAEVYLKKFESTPPEKSSRQKDLLEDDRKESTEAEDKTEDKDKKKTKQKTGKFAVKKKEVAAKPGSQTRHTQSGEGITGEVRKRKNITPEAQEKTLEDIEWEDKSTKKKLHTSTSTFSPGRHESSVEKGPSSAGQTTLDLDSVDWASKVKDAVYRPQRNRLLWVILASLLALSVAVAAALWYWHYSEQAPPVPEPPATAAPSDPADPGAYTTDIDDPQPDPATAALSLPETDLDGPAEEPAEDIEPASPDRPAEVALDPEDITDRVLSRTVSGDTLFLIVYARYGNLEPIRVDSDVFPSDRASGTALRPYWVEQQHAMRFEFIDQIVLQGTLSRMLLIYNGHVIDDFSPYYMDGPRIRITRNDLLENPDFSEANPSPFSGIPEPLALTDRPRFAP